MYDLIMIFEPASAPDRCANCGGVVSTRGRAPRDGRRFCSAKPCRAARVRFRRQAIADRREAPTACSGCGGTLSARPHRSGDELGRWCSRPTCQRKKREARQAVAGGVDVQRQAAVLETVVEFLGEAVMADSEDYIHSNRVVCHVCGLTSAILEWVHPDGPVMPFGACTGTLNGAKSRNIGMLGITGAWPFQRKYLSAEELEAAYGD